MCLHRIDQNATVFTASPVRAFPAPSWFSLFSISCSFPPRLSPADSNGIVIPKYWHGDLPFQRTRRSRQASGTSGPARRPAGYSDDVVQDKDGDEGCADGDGGVAGSRLTSHYIHAKHFLLTATHAWQLCLAPEGSIVERMHEVGGVVSWVRVSS